MIRIASLSLTALLIAAPAMAFEQTGSSDDLVPADAKPLTPEESAQLAAALEFDPTEVATRPAQSLSVPRLPQPKSFEMTRSAQPYGASTYTFKRALPGLGANFGADLGTGADPVHYYQPDRPIVAPDRNSGAAWASVDVTSNASIAARVDPGADQGRLATTVRHSLPVGSSLSLTLQNTSGVTDSLGVGMAATAPAGLPMMTLPQADGSGTTQVWDDRPSVKLDVASTGTSFSAGLARSSTDPVTHNHFSAEQKIYGPLHVSTAITDVGETSENRSINAGLKFHW